MKPTSISSGRRSLLAVVLIASFTTATTIVRPAETPATPPAGSDAGATSEGSAPSSQPGAAAPAATPPSPPAATATSSTAAPAESSAAADPAPVIELARQYLGGDAVLDAVHSIRYVGTVNIEGSDATDRIDMLVCKPLKQHTTVTITATQERRITALDEYDGWARTESPNDPGRGVLRLLQADDVRRMRASTWQNVYFYRNIASVGGRIEHRGEAEVDGVLCHKLAFLHPRTIQFVRYYDKSNGRLVLTETESGGTIRERGEMVVQGIRFPKELMNTLDGKTTTVVFTEIVVNPDCPPELFAMPKLPVPRFAPPAQ